RLKLPEMPAQRFERLQRDHNLTSAEAAILAYDEHLMKYYEVAASITKSPKLINWVLRDLLAYLKEHNMTVELRRVEGDPLHPKQLAALVQLIEEGTINARSAQEIFVEMAST